MSCDNILSGKNAGICTLSAALSGMNLSYCSYEYEGKRILANCNVQFELPIGTTIVRPFDSIASRPCVGIRANQMLVTNILPTNPLHQEAKVDSAYEPPAEWYPEWGAQDPFNFVKGETTIVKNLDLNLDCSSQIGGLNFYYSFLKKNPHLTIQYD